MGTPGNSVPVRYDGAAAAYDAFVRDSWIHKVAIPALLELCQPAGCEVLDLGCGQGVLARELAARGDRVTAVDISQGLLDLARRYESDRPLGISYLHGDASTLAGLADESFDGVASCLTFTDLDDFDAVIQSVVRVLRPRGWFSFACLHPCFEPPHVRSVEVGGRLAKQINRYFDEGWWRSKNPDSLLVWRHHRRLSTILNTLVEAGLSIDHIEEPPGRADVLDEAPIYGEVAEVLAVRATLQR